jgi:hypothetical protein
VGALLSSTWVIVDVRSVDAPRIIVPVPLGLARTALAFAPDEARRIDLPELEDYADVAEEIVEELIDAADGVLVEAHDRDERISISKGGDAIEIRVEGDDEEVSVRIPLTVAADVLDSYRDDVLETREALEALSSISRSELVHVRTENEEVRVWIW